MTRSGAQFLMVVSTLGLLTGVAMWKGVFTHRIVLPALPETGYAADERRDEPATPEDRMTEEQLAREEAEVEAMDLASASDDRPGGRTGSASDAMTLAPTGDAAVASSAASRRAAGSIPFPVQRGQSREAEAADMRAMARISVEEAEALALDEYPGGTVTTAVLGHETGYLVYTIVIADKDGSTHDVQVDAGNGNVLGTAKAFVGEEEIRRPQ